MLLIAHWVIVAGAALLGAAVGGTVGYFWDDITAWANRVIGYIIDAINYAIEVTSDAIVSLVKEGQRYYKLAEVYVMDIRTNKVRVESRRQEIPSPDVPQEYKEQLMRKAKLKLMQNAT